MDDLPVEILIFQGRLQKSAGSCGLDLIILFQTRPKDVQAMRGALQPGPYPRGFSNVNDMAESHVQVARHADQPMGEQAICHGGIQ
jgi:hypothetical protein